MDWDAIFGAMNLLAMLCWAALILGPRKPLLLSSLLIWLLIREGRARAQGRWQ